MHHQPVAVLDLDQHVEGRRRLALEDGFLCAAPPSFFVGERHALDAANQICQRRVHHQVVERLTVRGADQLDAPFGDRTRGLRFQLTPDLVNYDHFGHMVLDGLDHDLVLQHGRRHLHAPRLPDGRVWDIAIPANFVRRVHDHHALGVA